MALFSQDLFQMWEPLICPDIRIWSLSCQLFAYFCFQSLAHGVADSFSHLHQSFFPKTLLRVSGSWSPKPPCFLGLQILSHVTKAHFFLVSSLPQRKYLWMFLNCCKTPLGAGRVESIKIGVDCRSAFVSTNLPARFKDLIVHFLTLSCSLLITSS